MPDVSCPHCRTVLELSETDLADGGEADCPSCGKEFTIKSRGKAARPTSTSQGKNLSGTIAKAPFAILLCLQILLIGTCAIVITGSFAYRSGKQTGLRDGFARGHTKGYQLARVHAHQQAGLQAQSHAKQASELPPEKSFDDWLNEPEPAAAQQSSPASPPFDYSADAAVIGVAEPQAPPQEQAQAPALDYTSDLDAMMPQQPTATPPRSPSGTDAVPAATPPGKPAAFDYDAFMQQEKSNPQVVDKGLPPADARAASRASSLPGRARAATRTYAAVGSGHWITENIDDGAFIRLEDRSLWKIDHLDRTDTVLWLATTAIAVVESDSGSPGFDYLLINTDDDEKAHASYLGKQ